MVYIACLAAGVAIALEQGAGHWRDRLALEMTVELPAPAGESEDERQERLAAAMEQIGATPGIESARLLDQAAIQELLRPWLEDVDRLEIPLPDLAAIALRPGASIDLDDLKTRLAPVSPGARLEDHADFAERALGLLANLERAALGLLGAVLIASAGLIAFVALTGLSIHRRVVEILALFGADDAYVARQFQMQALRFGAPGAMLGAGLAALTLHFGLAWLASDEGLALPGGLDGVQVLALIAIPIVTLAITIVTARVVVLVLLGREG
jgi:cell division transport system permease protein